MDVCRRAGGGGGASIALSERLGGMRCGLEVVYKRCNFYIQILDCLYAFINSQLLGAKHCIHDIEVQPGQEGVVSEAFQGLSSSVPRHSHSRS